MINKRHLSSSAYIVVFLKKRPFIYSRSAKKTLMQETSPTLSDYISKKIVSTRVLAQTKTRDFNQRWAYAKIRRLIDNFLQGDIEDRIVVMPGLRGVGKTTILHQLYLYLTEERKIPLQRVLSFSATESKPIASVSEIIDTYVEEFLHTTLEELNQKVFILIDEAQSYKNWADTIETKVYNATNNIFLIATGSSALSLESDSLGRKNVKETIFPLNFSEYLLLTHGIFPIKGLTNDIKKLLFDPPAPVRGLIDGSKQLIFDAADLDNLENKLWDLRARVQNAGLNLDNEFRSFLTIGGCPISKNVDLETASRRLSYTVGKVIRQDLTYKKSYTTETLERAESIVISLALKPPGPSPLANIANRFSIPKSTVHEIMGALLQAHLIFGVKPYHKQNNKPGPWNFYFVHPSINAALRYTYSSFNPYDRNVLGTLVENLVAASFFRMKETATNLRRKPVEIFYPPDISKKNVDFLIQDALGGILPVEIGIHKRDTTQVENAISDNECEYGILVTDVQMVSKKDNVLLVPLSLFALA